MIPDNLLPLDLQQTAFIAGGWAVNPVMATEIDVWAIVTGGESLGDARERVLAPWRAERMLGWEPSTQPQYFIDDIAFIDVAVVTRGVLPHMKAQPLRVRLTTAKSLLQVLEVFGRDEHAIAIDRRARVFTAPRYGSDVFDTIKKEDLDYLWGV